MGGVSPADVRLMVAKAGRLTQDWIAAQATLPLEWRLIGVVRGPREVAPAIRGDSGS